MGSKDKKRKRAEDAASNQSQAQQATSIKISSIKAAGSCPPVIAAAPSLRLNKSVQFQAYEKASPAPANKRSKKNPPPGTELELRSTSHPTLDYTAKQCGPGQNDSNLKHYIGVYDPTTGKVDIIEAKKVTVRGTVKSQQPPAQDLEAPKKSMFELRTDLGHAFGTKKAKKALAAVTENAIAPEKAIADASKLNSESRAVMDQIRDYSATTASREDLQAAADAAKPVPRANLDATEIQDVYTPESLIGYETLSAIPIKDWQDVVKGNGSGQHSSMFVAGHLRTVGSGPDSVKRLRTLRYLEFLLRFLKSARPGKERGTRRVPQRDKLQELLKPAPAPVVDSIRKKFARNGEMRKTDMDLLYTYCCALSAVTANFEFDTGSIRFDMGLDEKQFSQYFKEIGGRIKSVANPERKGAKVQMANLSLPLEFPRTRIIPSSRR